MTRKTMGSTPTVMSNWTVLDHDGNVIHRCVELDEAIRERRAKNGGAIVRVDIDVSP